MKDTPSSRAFFTSRREPGMSASSRRYTQDTDAAPSRTAVASVDAYIGFLSNFAIAFSFISVSTGSFGNFGVNLLHYQKAPVSSGTGVTVPGPRP